MATAGDIVDGVLSNLITSLLVTLIFALGLAWLEGGAPNQFISTLILVITALLSWLFGRAYGKRKHFREMAHRSKGAGR